MGVKICISGEKLGSFPQQLQGIRYASCRLPDGVTYLNLLELEDGIENPLPALPEAKEFQEKLKSWLAEHPGGPYLFCQAGEVARSKKRSRTTGHQVEKKRSSSMKGTSCSRATAPGRAASTD